MKDATQCAMCHGPLYWLGWLDLGVRVGVYFCYTCDRRKAGK